MRADGRCRRLDQPCDGPVDGLAGQLLRDGRRDDPARLQLLVHDLELESVDDPRTEAILAENSAEARIRGLGGGARWFAAQE